MHVTALIALNAKSALFGMQKAQMHKPHLGAEEKKLTENGPASRLSWMIVLEPFWDRSGIVLESFWVRSTTISK